MDASPTLQDFVLDLLYRPEARTAFEADPQAALQQAGLGDISPVDVQQVLPLVVDYAPVSGVTGLTGVDDLSHGVANLDVAGAVAHLQTITALAPVQSTVQDLNVTAAGVHSVGVAGDDLLSGSVLSGGALGLPGVGGVTAGGVADLSVDHDPALDLDAGVAVHGAVDAVVPVGVDLHPDTDLRPIETLDHVAGVPSSIDLSHATGLDVPGVEGATSSVVSVVNTDLTDDVVHSVHGTVAGTVSGTVDTVHGVTGGLLGGTGAHADADADTGHGALGGLTDLHL